MTDLISIGAPFVLALYWALLLWCRKQGNTVVPWHVLMAIRMKSMFSVKLVLDFSKFQAALKHAEERVLRLGRSLHAMGDAVDGA